MRSSETTESRQEKGQDALIVPRVVEKFGSLEELPTLSARTF